MGYIAHQGAALGEQLLKVQDTIPICPPQLSQHLALGAVAAGRPWVAERVAAIAGNRRGPRSLPCAVGHAVPTYAWAPWLPAGPGWPSAWLHLRASGPPPDNINIPVHLTMSLGAAWWSARQRPVPRLRAGAW